MTIVPNSNIRRLGRGTFIATDDPSELPPPRLPPGADVGWAVSELFEAAWIASGRDPEELRRSPRSRGVDPRSR
jgi:hypothetical protein